MEKNKDKWEKEYRLKKNQKTERVTEFFEYKPWIVSF